MSKVDKKRKKLQERIDFLENELRMSLTKKDSSTKEINVAKHQSEIIKLKKDLMNL
jgi:thiamine biosynthesis lipoprotein ApbE